MAQPKQCGGEARIYARDAEREAREEEEKEKEFSVSEKGLKDYLSRDIEELINVNDTEMYDLWYDRIYDEDGTFKEWSARPIRPRKEAEEMAIRRKARRKVNKWVDNKLRNLSPDEKEKKIKQIRKDYDGGFIASLMRGSRFLEKKLPVTKSILSAYRKKGKKGKQSKKKKGSKKKGKSKNSKNKKQGGGKSRKPKKAKKTQRKPRKSRSRKPKKMKRSKRAGAGNNPYPLMFDPYDTYRK